jgi:hypothetical protein
VTVTAIQPASGLTTGGTAVTISGSSNFVAGATVLFGGHRRFRRERARPDDHRGRDAGRLGRHGDVRVTNPGGPVRRRWPAASPTCPGRRRSAGVTPAQGSWFGGTVVTITGTNFAGGMTVSVGGVAATNVAVVSTRRR